MLPITFFFFARFSQMSVVYFSPLSSIGRFHFQHPFWQMDILFFLKRKKIKKQKRERQIYTRGNIYMEIEENWGLDFVKSWSYSVGPEIFWCQTETSLYRKLNIQSSSFTLFPYRSEGVFGTGGFLWSTIDGYTAAQDKNRKKLHVRRIWAQYWFSKTKNFCGKFHI